MAREKWPCPIVISIFNRVQMIRLLIRTSGILAIIEVYFFKINKTFACCLFNRKSNETGLSIETNFSTCLRRIQSERYTSTCRRLLQWTSL